jgi:hypothetical protein
VGGFFVPFLNLVRPHEVMKEVWRGSAFLAGTSTETRWDAIKPDRLVGLWWGLFILSSMVANTSGRLTMSAKSLPELLDAAHMSLAADLLEIPAALVAIQLVWRITRLQQQARVEAVGELSAPACIGG